MFRGARTQLAFAVFYNEYDKIQKLVEKKGVKILNQRSSVSLAKLDRALRPGDNYLEAAYKSPLPLTVALMCGNDAMADFLVSLGAQPHNKIDDNYPNAAFLAAALGRRALLARWLEEYPSLRDVRNVDGDSLLHIAALHAQAGVVTLLLDDGFSTTECSRRGHTPLSYAEMSRDSATIAPLRRAYETPLGIAPLAGSAGTVDAGWRQLDALRIARVRDETAIGYRLTEIFNFETGELMRLQRNLQTDIESPAVITPFDELAERSALAEAATRLGLPLPSSKK